MKKKNSSPPDQSEARLERFAESLHTKWLRIYRPLAIVFAAVIIGCMLATVASLPSYGGKKKPADNVVEEKYLTDSIEDTGAVNVVSGMILDYRAFDTFGESTVLFVAAGAVIVLLHGQSHDQDAAWDETRQKQEADPILKTVTLWVFPAALLFGIYVVLNGHLSPGGGFSGGAVMGAALILYENAFGAGGIRRVLSWHTLSRVIAAALLLYAAVKGYSFYMGAHHLETGIPLGTPGAILSAGLILPLNLCVGLIVTFTMYGFYVLISGGDV